MLSVIFCLLRLWLHYCLLNQRLLHRFLCINRRNSIYIIFRFFFPFEQASVYHGKKWTNVFLCSWFVVCTLILSSLFNDQLQIAINANLICAIKSIGRSNGDKTILSHLVWIKTRLFLHDLHLFFRF